MPKQQYKTLGDKLTAADIGKPVGGKNSNRYKFKIWVELEDLIDLDLETLNDRVSAMLEEGWMLDMCYQVVGHRKKKSDHFVAGQVLIKMSVEIDGMNFEEE